MRQAAHELGPGDVGRPHDEEGHGDEHHRQCQRGRRVVLPLQIDRQRHGARHPLLGAGEGDGRSELAQAPAQGECCAASQGRSHQRQGDARQQCPRARAQSPGDRLDVGVAAAQHGLEGHHEVGHGDEDLCDDDSRGREGDLHVHDAQGPPEQTPLAQRRQQGDSRHYRRHGHRQHCEHAAHAHASPLPRQQERQRHAEADRDHGGDDAGAQRQAESAGGRLRRQQRRQLCPGHTRAQPDEGQDDGAGTEHAECEHGQRKWRVGGS